MHVLPTFAIPVEYANLLSNQVCEISGADQ